MIALYQFLDNPSDYILLLQALQIADTFYNLILKRINSTNNSPLDIIIEMNIRDICTKAQAIKELLIIISKYDRKQLFESLLEILFNNPTDKELEFLRAQKDIMINSQLKTNKEILDDILLSDDEDINEMGVNQITIHRAKGLVFKCVFIISVNDKKIPQSLKNEDGIKEERRLFYLAMTRAKEYLYLSSAEYHIIHGMRIRLNPSIFVNELN
jgi:DNA helicase-2/ATP-dependent DNA helicase PcrA